MKVAIVSTHPIQYQTPWFRELARQHIELKVYYALLPDPQQQGVGFGEAFVWDIPLLEGYDWELLLNKRRFPSLKGFFRSSTPVIYSKLADAKPDVVIITGWQSLPLLQALLAAFRLGIPCIVRGESNGLRQRPLLVRVFHRLLFSRFDAFLAIGKLNRQFYLEYGIPEEEVFSAPYFVDNQRFADQFRKDALERSALRAEWNIGKGRPATADRRGVCFLFAGKLEPKKRIMDLLRAMDLAREKQPSIHLLVAGAGELLEEARQFAESRSLPVTFAGFLNQTEITRAYAAADCLVLPSDHGETWGLVVNEAMACGLPAIVSDRVGCGPDLVEEAVTGSVFPCGDVDALANKLVDLASDPEKLVRMGEQARRRIKDYSVQRAVQGTMRAIEFVAGGGRLTTADRRPATDDLSVFASLAPLREKIFTHERKDAETRRREEDNRLPDGLVSPLFRHSSPVPSHWTVSAPRSSARVLHVIPSLSPKDGGPSFALPMIVRGLELLGVHVDVATTEGANEQRIDRNEGNVFYFPRQSELYKVSLPLSRWLSAHIRDYDLVHIHALFSYSSYAAARLATKNGIPYIVRPLGVLNRWGMQNRRRLLKRLSFRFVEQRIVRNAAAIHYTSQQERLEAEETGVSADSVVIPLGVDLSAFHKLPGPERFLARFPHARGREIILFLSRLDPKKGLDLLLQAFAENDRRRETGDGPRSSVGGRLRPLLVIAGEGDGQFVAGLRRLAEELGIAGETLWTGFLGGDDKLSALAAASLFVLPSYSENFGVALVEAMAAGLPCLMSDQVGVAVDAKEYDAGLAAPCEVAPLASAMRRLLDDPELRGRLGANARRLVEDRFSLEAMSNSLVELYDRVLPRQRSDVDVTRVTAQSTRS